MTGVLTKRGNLDTDICREKGEHEGRDEVMPASA